MNIDAFLYHLLLLVIPGFVGLLLSKKLSAIGKDNKTIKSWNDVLALVTFSFIGCLIFDVIGNFIKLINNNYIPISTIKILQSTTEYYSATQFVLLILINAILGLIYALLYNKKIIYRIGKWMKLTKQFGEEDVWSFFNNAKEVEWVYVRNYKNNCTYYGYIQLFSDSYEQRELLMSDVDVYSTDTGEFLYSVDKAYLCLEYCDVSIEIPKKEEVNARETDEPVKTAS